MTCFTIKPYDCQTEMRLLTKRNSLAFFEKCRVCELR
uniref:Uncharacterized protein n=1 Tax=Siphoviridae sp. ctyjS2 TaxID=2827284 RepID=A0A8S5R4T1_9CAUD|nr:MAG TPA: hypothetical protein [Siphoviridae sp. ctyjS2]